MRKVFAVGFAVGMLLIFLAFVSWFSFDTTKAEKVRGVQFERRWSEIKTRTDDDGVTTEKEYWYADISYKGKLYKGVVLSSKFTSEDDAFYLYEDSLYSDKMTMSANESAFFFLLLTGFVITVIFGICLVI